MNVHHLMQATPIVPTLNINNVSEAKPLAEALIAGGLNTFEVPLSTSASLDAIRAISDVSGAIVGAVITGFADELKRAQDHGASFAVNACFTPGLAKTANAINMPFIPGATIPAEIIMAKQHGITVLKFYPTDEAYGVDTLKIFAEQLKDSSFCPTGDFSAATAKEFLALPNVLSVSGSWLAPRNLVEAGDWGAITELAKSCLTLCKQ